MGKHDREPGKNTPKDTGKLPTILRKATYEPKHGDNKKADEAKKDK